MMRIKSIFRKGILFIIISMFVNLHLTAYADFNKGYRVLIGADKDTVLRQKGADILVIDAEYFSKEEIKKLHKTNKQIYSYLSIGSLENFRRDYEEYKKLALGKYENWEEEMWVLVSNPRWQKRLVKKAKDFYKKGVDGLFLDNADVYYHYKTKDVYQGLLAIVESLSDLKKPLIVNGGDVFVKEAIKKNELKKYVYGVNQEGVFTATDFERKIYSKNTSSEIRYYKEYLKICKDYGLKVHLLEYGADEKTMKEIKAYCEKHSFRCFFAKSIELRE